MKSKRLDYEMFKRLVDHATISIKDASGENCVGFVCPYCGEIVYFDECEDALVSRDNECPKCHVSFVESEDKNEI